MAPNLSSFSDFDLIGHGTGSDTYRATRISSGGRVSIKAVLIRLGTTIEPAELERRIAALSTLRSHPNLTRLDDVIQADGAVYVVGEYLPTSLPDRLRTAPYGLSIGEVTSMGHQLAAGLAVAHEAGLVHGDVQPANVLFGAGGIAKLADLGTTTAVLDRSLTRTDSLQAAYASPQERTGDAVTAWDDVYSLGATLLHAITGRVLAPKERDAGVDRMLGTVPHPLRGIIERCLAIQPAERPAAAAIVAALPDTTPRAASAPTGSFAPPNSQPTAMPAPGAAPVAPRTPVTPAAPSRPRQTSTIEVPSKPWYRQPTLFGLLLVAALFAGGVFWFLGRQDDDATIESDSTAPVSTNVVTLPEVTVPEATEPTVATTVDPATTEPVATTPPGPGSNPYGDVTGQPVVAPASAAGQFSLAVQQGLPPVGVTPHSDAYYYAMWSNLVARSADPAAPVVATADGYALSLRPGLTDLYAFVPADGGPITDLTESVAGVPVDVDTQIAGSGICTPTPEPGNDSCTAGLAGGAFVADLNGTGGQLFNLAHVTLDPATDSLLMYIDIPGGQVTAAIAQNTIVAVDPTTNIIAVTYGKSPPPGTTLTLGAVTADGRNMVFQFAIA